MNYDVLELRRAAAEVRGAASAIKGAEQDNVSRTKTNLTGSFRGEAANALDHELSNLQSDLQRLAGGLSTISSELIAFAKRLEQADQDAAGYIQRQ